MIKQRKNKYCHLLWVAFLLTACKLQKPIEMDVVYVNSQPSKVIYQQSYPLVNDIIHTKLDLSFNWDSAFVYGKATITAQPYFEKQNTVKLNAKGMLIKQVLLLKDSSTSSLFYTYDKTFLNINLDKYYLPQEKYTLVIDYIAKPKQLQKGVDINSEEDRGIYFIKPKGKNRTRQLWTQGETENNSVWFPTINGPQEKITHQINITVDSSLKTLSNGLLTESIANSGGTRTDKWMMDKPHATYLAMIAVGEFVITIDKWRQTDLAYYMEPAFSSSAKAVFGKTPQMIEFFSNKLKYPYPWQKYSQIVVRDFVSGAMENTTATVFYDELNKKPDELLDVNYEDIIAHELFHHWFGDLVTCESWANLPLNESFATYGEYLWIENAYGKDAADEHLLQDALYYFDSEKQKQEKLIRFDYDDKEQMFDANSYQKGGIILHMLRQEVGDEAFFKSLNHYLTKHDFKTVEIHDLRLAFEEVIGRDLNWFFNQWFFASGHPVLNITKNYDPTKNKIFINISQIQDLETTPLYTLPLKIKIYDDKGVRTKQVILSKQKHIFEVDAATEPQLVITDSDYQLLIEKNEIKTADELAYQYRNTDSFTPHLESVNFFIKNKNHVESAKIMITALNDNSNLIKIKALEFVKNLAIDKKNEAYELVKELALKSSNSKVRATAISVLKKEYKTRNNAAVFKTLKADKSPLVKKALK